jgi:hypothetical protein
MNIYKQRGSSMWLLMMGLGVITFFAYVGMKMVPVYLNNTEIKNAMQIALDKQNVRTISRTSVYRVMEKQLYLDGVHNQADW